MTDRIDRLVELARAIVEENPTFHAVRGAGAGDHATAAFLRELRARARAAFVEDCSEQRICGPTGYAVDFYFAPERTVVEIALGLPNPGSEFEKDLLKAIIAQDYHRVDRLVLVSRAGGEKKCRQPGRSALIAWALAEHNLQVSVIDLGGVPRKRVSARNRRLATQ